MIDPAGKGRQLPARLSWCVSCLGGGDYTGELVWSRRGKGRIFAEWDFRRPSRGSGNAPASVCTRPAGPAKASHISCETRWQATKGVLELWRMQSTRHCRPRNRWRRPTGCALMKESSRARRRASKPSGSRRARFDQSSKSMVKHRLLSMDRSLSKLRRPVYRGSSIRGIR